MSVTMTATPAAIPTIDAAQCSPYLAPGRTRLPDGGGGPPKLAKQSSASAAEDLAAMMGMAPEEDVSIDWLVRNVVPDGFVGAPGQDGFVGLGETNANAYLAPLMVSRNVSAESASSVDSELPPPMVYRNASAASVDSTCSEEASGGRGTKQNKTPWTREEDQLIEQGVRTFGNKWSRIAEMLPSERTDDSVRNRWNRLQRRALRVTQKSARAVPPVPGAREATNTAADALSKVYVSDTPEDPGRNGDMWTAQEDELIDDCVRNRGLKWRAVAALLPGRTDSGCRNRWVRTQERLLAAAGTTVHGAAEVFAALRAAGQLKHSSSTDIDIAPLCAPPPPGHAAAVGAPPPPLGHAAALGMRVDAQ